MCEFKVFIKDRDRESKVAEDIVRVYYEEGKLVLMDILGNKKYIEGALISSIDVGKEKLEILQQPVVKAVIKFIEKYNECLQKNVYSLEIEEAWEEVKSKGDFIMRELWKMYGKQVT